MVAGMDFDDDSVSSEDPSPSDQSIASDNTFADNEIGVLQEPLDDDLTDDSDVEADELEGLMSDMLLSPHKCPPAGSFTAQQNLKDDSSDEEDEADKADEAASSPLRSPKRKRDATSPPRVEQNLIDSFEQRIQRENQGFFQQEAQHHS